MSQINNNTPAVNSATTNTEAARKNPEALLLNMIQNSDAVNSAAEFHEENNQSSGYLEPEEEVIHRPQALHVLQNSGTVNSSSDVQGVNNKNSASQGTQIEFFTRDQENRLWELMNLKAAIGDFPLPPDLQKEFDKLSKIQSDNNKLAKEHPGQFLDAILAFLSPPKTAVSKVRNLSSSNWNDVMNAMGILEGENTPPENAYLINSNAYFLFIQEPSDLNHDGNIDHEDLIAYAIAFANSTVP